MSKVTVNKEKCIGCGACVAIAPENFDFNDEGISIAISDNITEATKEAEEACPVLAIDLITSCDCGDNCSCGNECNCDDECDCCDECDCDDECDCCCSHDCCDCSDECDCDEN